MVRDLTRGNPLKLIVSFCLPLMIGQFFQQFYNMVDSIIVGRFVGTLELSAVGSTGSLSFMVIGFVLGLCSGLSIPVSQSFGAGDFKRMRRCFANALYIAGVTAVIVTAVTAAFTRPLLKVMNTPDEIIDLAYSYIFIVFCGLTATFFYNLFAAVIRAIGNSKTPLYFLIFSSFLNIVLDLFFVIVLDMSVKGVAIATVISQAASALLCLFVIIKKFDELHIKRDEFKPDLRLCGRMLYLALPMALQFSITAVGSVMLQSAVNKLGSSVIAAVTVAGKIQLMIILPAETIGLTMATFCGQNLGARRMDRISEGVNKSLFLAMGYCAVGIFIARVFGEDLALLFVDGSQGEVIALVKQFLSVCSWFYPMLAVLFIYRNAIQGLGYSIPAMLAGVFELIARAIMGFWVISIYGYDAVCFANPAAWLAADLMLIPFFYFIFSRLKKKILQNTIDNTSALT